MCFKGQMIVSRFYNFTVLCLEKKKNLPFVDPSNNYSLYFSLFLALLISRVYSNFHRPMKSKSKRNHWFESELDKPGQAEGSRWSVHFDAQRYDFVGFSGS